VATKHQQTKAKYFILSIYFPFIHFCHTNPYTTSWRLSTCPIHTNPTFCLFPIAKQRLVICQLLNGKAALLKSHPTVPFVKHNIVDEAKQ
jgi:hypothetical protein